MASKQRQVTNDFTATFTRQTVQAWSRMVKEWEADPSYPNPYISKEQGTPFSIPWGLVYLIIIFVSIEGFRGVIVAHSRRGRRGGKGERNASQGFRISLHTHGPRTRGSTVRICATISFLVSDHKIGLLSSLWLPRRPAQIPRKQCSSSAEMHSSTRSRNGVNYKRFTCLEYSMSTPLTRNLHGGRRWRQSSYGCPPSSKAPMNVPQFVYQALSAARKSFDLVNFKIPSMTSARHDGSVVGSSHSTRFSSWAKARRLKQNLEQSCRQSKTGLTSLSGVTVLLAMHSSNWTPVETGKTSTLL